MYSFKDYEKMPLSLTINEMEKIYEELLRDSRFNETSKEIFDEFLEKVVRYNEYRAKWLLLEKEEKLEKDSYRTSIHDSIIISLNVLARYLRKQGLKCNWRDVLGDETKDKLIRKRIGDFACYIAFILSLNAR